MTDRYNALTVVLDKDTRSDDCEPLMQAIAMLKGVCSVQGHVRDVRAAVAEDRARNELSIKVLDLVRSIANPTAF